MGRRFPRATVIAEWRKMRPENFPGMDGGRPVGRPEERTAMRPPPKPAYVTPERVQQFAAYLAHNRAWGIFHVSLSDGNYEYGAAPESSWGVLGAVRDPETLRDMALYFAKLSPSQRRKLGEQARRVCSDMGMDR